MKKFLLGTTAFVAAATLATAAQAGDNGLNVELGGFADFQAGFADQDTAFTATGANSRDFKIQNDTEIHVKVSGKTDSGLGYGAVIELNADVSGDADADGGNSDKTYLFIESDSMGRVEMGSNAGAQQTKAITAASIARATGGVDGDWYDFVNTGGANFILSPELPAAAAAEGGTREDSNKITYYTPNFSGFSAGLSFSPDEGDAGTAAGFTGQVGTDVENVFGLGLSYDADYDNVAVGVSLTGEFGESENPGFEDTAAWGIGLSVGTAGFSVAGSYADWSDSNLAVGATNDDQTVWSLGAAYEMDKMGVSLTYLDSESTGNDFTNVSVGADYQLAPGLTSYVEVSFFDLDAAGAGADNDGSVVLIGSELSF